MTETRIASASELHGRAWRATAATWPTILVITCIISLTSYVAAEILSLIPVVGGLLLLALELLMTVPTMGLVNGTINYLRRGSITVEHVTSMFSFIPEMICYRLWEELFMFLWMLPGLLTTMIGYFTLFVAGVGGDSVMGIIALTFIIGGIVLMLALSFRAELNYAMSACLIVDEPTMGGIEALRRSKQMMRGNRWRYIKISLPVLLITVLILVIHYLTRNTMLSAFESFLISMLGIIPGVLGQYLAPVLYEELRSKGHGVQ